MDQKDKKILSLLHKDARISNHQIGKKIRLSKPAVDNRIKNLEKNKIISHYYTVVDLTKLGYFQYKLYFRFQNTSINKEKEIINYWINDKNSVWVAKLRGSFDLAISLVAKNNFELANILDKFLDRFSQNILEKNILLTEYSPIYSKEYLLEIEPFEFVYGIPEGHYKIDKKDEKILKVLSNRARIRIIDLMKETDLTKDEAMYHIKKLKKNKVIQGFRCELNLDKLGLKHYKIILRTKNFNKEHENQLREYSQEHKNITQFIKLIGSWDVELEFEVESDEVAHSILDEIRNKFFKVIRDFEIIQVSKIYKYTYFPF